MCVAAEPPQFHSSLGKMAVANQAQQGLGGWTNEEAEGRRKGWLALRIEPKACLRTCVCMCVYSRWWLGKCSFATPPNLGRKCFLILFHYSDFENLCGTPELLQDRCVGRTDTSAEELVSRISCNHAQTNLKASCYVKFTLPMFLNNNMCL